MKHCNTVHRVDLEYVKYKLPGYIHTFKTSDFIKPDNGKVADQGSKRNRDHHNNDHHSKKNRQDEPAAPPPAPCLGCGKPHKGGVVECQLKGHPDFNSSSSEWKSSDKGKA